MSISIWFIIIKISLFFYSRYFFKTKSDLLDDEECVVFQEATDENAFVPMLNNKVIAKIEKYNQN